MKTFTQVLLRVLMGIALFLSFSAAVHLANVPNDLAVIGAVLLFAVSATALFLWIRREPLLKRLSNHFTGHNVLTGAAVIALEGTVDNDMLLTADHGLSYGDVVQFNQSEIIQTLEA